jgi:hypothetical protein
VPEVCLVPATSSLKKKKNPHGDFYTINFGNISFEITSGNMAKTRFIKSPEILLYVLHAWI